MEFSYKKYLKIGELYITNQKETVITDLGSCISFVFFDPQSKICAMSHCQLPYDFFAKSDCRDSCPKICNREFKKENDFRFISCSFNYLMKYFRDKNISKEKLKVGLYGGGNVVNITNQIGTRNVEYAKNLLKENKIYLADEKTGGNTGIRININTENGATQVVRQ